MDGGAVRLDARSSVTGSRPALCISVAGENLLSNAILGELELVGPHVQDRPSVAIENGDVDEDTGGRCGDGRL